MALNILLEASPLDNGVPTTIRMSSAAVLSNGTQVDEVEWLPVITTPPSLSYSISAGSGEIAPMTISSGSINFRIGARYGNREWNKLHWVGQPVALWIGETGNPFSSYRKFFTGTLSGLARTGNTAELALRTMEGQLDVPLLSRRYAGTGGIEGPVGKKGALKPYALGNARFVSPVEVDPALLVYQVHGYGPVADIPQIYEFAQPLAPSKGDVAGWTQLAEAVLKPGEWITCKALGMFRLGGRPDKKLAADVIGGSLNGVAPLTVAGIIPLLLRGAGVSAPRIGDMSALDFSWSFYATDQITVAEVVKQAALDAGAYVFPNKEGIWKCGRHRAPKPAEEVRADRTSEPLLQTINELNVTDPTWKVEIGHTRCFTVHSESDVSPALIELEGKIVAQDEVLNDLREQAEQAVADANAAKAEIDAMLADGILDRSDKRRAVDDLERERVQHDQLEGVYAAYNVQTYWNDYDAAFNSLEAYMLGLSPSIYDNTANTPVDRNTYLARWAAYVLAKQTLLNRITGRTGQTSTWDGVTGPGKPQDNATVGAPPGTVVGTHPVEQVLDDVSQAKDDASKAVNALKDANGNIIIVRETIVAIEREVADAKQEVADARSDLQTAVSTAQTAADAAKADAASVRTDLIPQVDAAKAAASEAKADAAKVRTDLGPLITDAKKAGTDASAALDAEIARAKEAEGTITTKVTTAQGRADAAHTAISTETTQRVDGDTLLSQRIDTVESTAVTDKGTLNTRITNEVTTLTNADAAIGRRIDSVVTQANTDRGDYTTKISNEETARSNADAAMGSRTSSLESGFSGLSKVVANDYFDNGTTGWDGLSGVELIASSYGRRNVIRTPAGSLYNGATGRPVYITSDSQRFKLKASWRCVTGVSTYYFGIVFYDADGNHVAATDGTGNYPLGSSVTLDSTIHGWLDREVIIGRGLPGYSEFGGTLGIPAGAVMFRPIIFLNYNSVPGSITEVDYFTIEDVTAVEQVSATVRDEATASANRDSALGNRISTTEAKLNGDQDSTLAARIRDEAVASTNRDAAIGQRITTVETNYATKDQATNIANAKVSEEATTRSNADGALGQRIDSVVSTANSDRGNFNTRISDEATASVNRDAAIGNRTNTLESTATRLTDAAAKVYPGFENQSDNWGYDTELRGHNVGSAWETNHTKGAGIAFPPGFGSWLYMNPTGWTKTTPGKRYRAGFWVWQWSAPNGYGGAARVYWEGQNQTYSDGVYLGSSGNPPEATQPFYTNVPNGAWHCYASDIQVDDAMVSNAKSYWIRPRINIDGAPAGAGYVIAGWFFREVTGEFDNAAKISDEATTRANQDSALGTRISTTEAKLNGDQDSTLAARIRDEATASANRDTAVANRATALEAAATNAGNLVPNTAFATTDGWFLNTGPNGAFIERNRAGAPYMIGGIENNLCLFQSAGGSNLQAEMLSDKFAIKAGEYYQVQALTASHRCKAWISLFFYDANNGWTGYAGENFGARINNGGQAIVDHDVTGAMTVQAPPGTVAGRFAVRMYDVSQDGYVWCSRPYVGVVKPTTNQWNAYTPGNDRNILLSTNAKISDEATTRANQDTALGNRISTTEAKLNGGEDSWVAARIRDEATASANRDTALGNRTSVVEASATSGTSAAKNDNFANWSDPAGMPAVWTTWVAEGNYRFDRMAGEGGSPYAIRTLNDHTDASCGFGQPIATYPGKWVIEVTAESDGSGYRGAGVTWGGVHNLDFLGDPDTTGYVGDRGNTVRTWVKIIDVVHDRHVWTFHAMHGWHGFGRGIAPKYMKWHKLTLRPAGPGDLAGLKNASDIVAANGRITDEATASANRDGALGNRISTTEAQLSGGQDSWLAARIRDEATASANRDSALVNRANTLEAQFRGETDSTIAARIRDEATARTNADSALSTRASVLESSFSGNGGLILNGNFSTGADGWGLGGCYWVDNPGDMQGAIRSEGNASFTHSAFIPINPNHSYKLETRFAARGYGIVQYAGLECYDNHKNFLGNLYMPEVAGQAFGWDMYERSTTFTGTNSPGSPFYGASYQIPINCRFARPLFLMNYQGYGSAGSVVDVDYLRLVDVTENQATNARLNEEITTRSNADSALASRVGYMEAQWTGNNDSYVFARLRNEETARANAVSAVANRTSVVEAQVSNDSTNLLRNGIFNAPGFGQGTTGYPPSWGGWANDNNGYIGYNSRASKYGAPAPLQIDRQGDNNGTLQVLYGQIAAGWYVIEADVDFEDGNQEGSGIHVQFNNGYARNLSFGTEPDLNGGVGSFGNVNRKFSTMFYNGANTTQVNFYLMAGWTGFTGRGSYGFLRTIWHRAVLRPATDAEIKAQKVIDSNVMARVGTTESAISDLKGRTAAYWQTTAVAGNNRAQVTIRADANGGAGVDLVGDVRISGGSLTAGVITSANGSTTLNLDNGRMKFESGGYRLVEAAALGPNANMVLWYGPTWVGEGSETIANSSFALATDGKVYMGSAQLSTGSGKSVQTVGIGTNITRVLAPGESINFEAKVFIDAPTQGGALFVQVFAGPAGGGQTNIANGGQTYIGPNEPSGSEVTGVFTNNTGVKQSFTIRAVPNGYFGGSARASQSYLTA